MQICLLKLIYYQRKNRSLPIRKIGTHWCLLQFTKLGGSWQMGQEFASLTLCLLSAKRPFGRPGHVTQPNPQFKTWDIVSTINEKSRKTISRTARFEFYHTENYKIWQQLKSQDLYGKPCHPATFSHTNPLTISNIIICQVSNLG